MAEAIAGLADVLVKKGGYNATDAANAASGPRAAELAKEFGVGGASSGGGSANSMQKYLETYQQNLASTLGGDVASKIASGQQVGFDDIKSSIAPDTPYPELLNRTEMFNTYRSIYGIDKLEATMNDLKAQQDGLVAQTRINTNAERGKAVAQNVIEGRVSQQQRNSNEQMDFIQRQISRTNDQLTTAYGVVNMYMNFAGLDYQDAVQKYNTEFEQNLGVINLVRGIQSDSRDIVRLGMEGERLDMDKVRLESDLKQREIDNARANLQIYTNAITSGNLDMKNLSPDQKAQLSKLEVQSGLPVGFISSLQLDAKSRIAFTNTNNGVTQVGIIGADGNISVKSYGTNTGGSTQAQKQQVLQSNTVSAFNSLAGSDGYVSPETYKNGLNYWVSQGGDRKSFDASFAQFVNPTHSKQYGIPDNVANPENYKQKPYDPNDPSTL